MTADALRTELVALSRAIHATPELAYQERTAVKNIAALLEKHGHKVEQKLGGLETAFRTRVGPAGPAVALLAEYDALPQIGHACGHNLIAMSNVGAFLLAAERAKDLKVGVELVGTPAEEAGGGKIDLIDAGVFRDSVAVLSSHPSGDPDWEFGGSSLGVVAKRVVFHGVASHAAFSPHLGRNALSAAIRLFVAIDGWRQHLPADTRVHGIITKGGAAQNIIPELAECDIGLRAATVEKLDEMQRTFAQMVEGAAMQTGTKAEIHDDMRLYAPVKPSARDRRPPGGRAEATRPTHGARQVRARVHRLRQRVAGRARGLHRIPGEREVDLRSLARDARVLGERSRAQERDDHRGDPRRGGGAHRDRRRRCVRRSVRRRTAVISNDQLHPRAARRHRRAGACSNSTSRASRSAWPNTPKVRRAAPSSTSRRSRRCTSTCVAAHRGSTASTSRSSTRSASRADRSTGSRRRPAWPRSCSRSADTRTKWMDIALVSGAIIFDYGRRAERDLSRQRARSRGGPRAAARSVPDGRARRGLLRDRGPRRDRGAVGSGRGVPHRRQDAHRGVHRRERVRRDRRPERERGARQPRREGSSGSTPRDVVSATGAYYPPAEPRSRNTTLTCRRDRPAPRSAAAAVDRAAGAYLDGAGDPAVPLALGRRHPVRMLDAGRRNPALDEVSLGVVASELAWDAVLACYDE